MTLQDYIISLEEDIDKLNEYEKTISALDCCDNRELEVLESVLLALKQITRIE